MGVFNGFICDKCGREFRSGSKDYRPVLISLGIEFGRTSPSTNNLNTTQVWCRECIMKTGLHIPILVKDKKEAPAIKLTFEEKFSMLIEDMGFTKYMEE